ncbi:MAG: hypothetical protein HUJ56_11500 [Erysipelotrichaceae bacterium]|nr:hypothetical protein [Erysipelotrichaceae bacterium]
MWQIEETMLDVYLLLVHRIEGFGLSLKEFWETDTWTISKFYCTELELIEKEEKEYNKGKSGSSDGYLGENDPTVDALFDEMFDYED